MTSSCTNRLDIGYIMYFNYVLKKMNFQCFYWTVSPVGTSCWQLPLISILSRVRTRGVLLGGGLPRHLCYLQKVSYIYILVYIKW